MEHRVDERRWDLQRRASLLQGVRLFGGLTEPARLDLAARFLPRAVARDEIVFAAGRPADAIHVLAAGQVKIVRETEDGREAILRVIGPGELFGASGGWGETKYPASAVAIQDSVVLRTPVAAFAALLRSQPDVALALIHELGARLREAEERILGLQTERVERRIARVLLRLANKTGVKTSAGIEIGVPLSRQELADLVGSTLGTVSRTLSGWDQKGYVAAGRERVVLTMPHKLVAIADEIS